MAGVSAGTVDRVLHNRGDVSVSSREKVQKVLDEIDYHPNMFAIGLAAKKRYHIVCIIPYYIEHDYWHAVVAGIDRAAQELRPFNVGVSYLYYRHADKSSYKEACAVLREENTDAVLVAPNFREETIKLTAYLEGADIPYAFIDFNIEQTHALCYIGQDSKTSNPAEIQMQRRLEGFMQYLSEEHKDLTIHDIVLHKEDTDGNRRILDAFFKEHPQAVLGAVFNSRVYQVASYLHEKGWKLAGLVGYDLLHKNTEFLKTGEVTFLIGQRPSLQGYCGVKTLCNHVVFKRPVTAVKYMPIDILMKENIDFYFEFE